MHRRASAFLPDGGKTSNECEQRFFSEPMGIAGRFSVYRATMSSDDLL
jgi:hypothetical protein